jgi:heme oxygenase (biliverdin-IX-beta and delta-forming)
MVRNNQFALSSTEMIPSIAARGKAERMLLSRLRAETRQDHERLEADLDLLRADMGLESYRELIARFYGFYTPWEHEVIRNLPDNLTAFFSDRRKVPMLLADLEFLGHEATDSLPLCRSLPPLDNVPRILGSLYVVEGATLGGQLISRHMEQALGLRDGRGYAFFSSYGSQVGNMWRTFRDLLLTASTAQDEDEIVGSATQTFRDIHAWLCEMGA